MYQQLKLQSFIMTGSTFVCVLFGQESSNKWWNIEEKGFSSESIAQKHGLEMLSNVWSFNTRYLNQTIVHGVHVSFFFTS